MRPRDLAAITASDSSIDVLETASKETRALLRVSAELVRYSRGRLSELERTIPARQLKLEASHAKACALITRAVKNIERSKRLLSESRKCRLPING